jgi:hypothetical protein
MFDHSRTRFHDKNLQKKAAQHFHCAVSKVFDKVKSVALWSANIRKLAKDHKDYGSAATLIYTWPLTHIYTWPLTHIYTWPLTHIYTWSLTHIYTWTLTHIYTWPLTHIYTWPLTLLAWYRHFSEKWRGVKLVLWAQTSSLSEMMLSCKCCPHITRRTGKLSTLTYNRKNR